MTVPTTHSHRTDITLRDIGQPTGAAISTTVISPSEPHIPRDPGTSRSQSSAQFAAFLRLGCTLGGSPGIFG